MSVGLYQKRPVTVEAVQWTGDNLEEIVEFAGDEVTWDVDQQTLYLGDFRILEGDYIVRDSALCVDVYVKGHFEATHVKVVAD
jgi:hypothetical protein